jgi:hypothetical protein
MFGFEFTLLRLGAKPPDATPIRAAARTKRLPLKILDLTTEALLQQTRPRTSFHYQPEAQHPKSSTIHKLAGRLPHLSG